MTTISADRREPLLEGWRDADPWVTAGIAFLGEMLVVRGLCAANPASNTGDSYVGASFTFEPGRFTTADLEVRWNRHVGAASVQNRPCSRSEWAELMSVIRDALAQSRAA